MTNGKRNESIFMEKRKHWGGGDRSNKWQQHHSKYAYGYREIKCHGKETLSTRMAVGGCMRPSAASNKLEALGVGYFIDFKTF